MIDKAINLFKLGFSKLTHSIRRFPEAIFFCIATTGTLIFINHIPTSMDDEVFYRIAFALAIGVPLFLCLKITFERFYIKRSLRIIGLLSGAGIQLLYLSMLLRRWDFVSQTRYIAFSIALYLAFVFIPYLFNRKDFELYVMRLFTQFAITYIYSLVLFLGLAGILGTVDALFNIDIDYNLYIDMFLTVAGIFAPAFFLADIPRAKDDLSVENYSKVLKILLIYIVSPILVAYAAVLYAFFIKIIVIRQWPQSMVSHLVLWFSIISTGTVFLIYPLRQEGQWPRAITSMLPKAILPLLAMMFVAMGIRIEAYGITENRYFVLAAGLWTTGCMLYLATRKDAKNIFMATSLALIATLSVVGPWSSFVISQKSQIARLEDILDAKGMLSGGEVVVASQELIVEEKAQITDILRYLDTKHDFKRVNFLPKGFEMDQMEEVFGFDATFDRKDTDYFHHYLAQSEMALEISDYDFFASSEALERENGLTLGTLKIDYTPSTGDIEIMSGESSYENNVKDLAVKIHSSIEGHEELSQDNMSFIDDRDHIKVFYFIESFSGRGSSSTGGPKVDWIKFYLFWKLK